MDGNGGSDHEDEPENSPTLREGNLSLPIDENEFKMQDSMMATPNDFPFEIHTA